MIARLLQASLAALWFAFLSITAPAAELPAKVTADPARPEQWLAMAEIGDPLAQALLARAYLYGTDGKAENRKVATVWAARSATEQHPLGLFLLGCCRYFDPMQPEAKNEEAAKPLFERALAAGFEKEAEQGGRQWLALLGNAHGYGFGMPENTKEAVKWWRKAADLGDPNAMFRLGHAYSYGYGVSKDEDAGLQWYRKAAALGEAEAMAFIGGCYENGHGVPMDDVAAVEWYRKSADRGSCDGMYDLGNCYIYGKGVPKNEPEGVKWLLKAADVDSTDAMRRLGDCYKDGIGVSMTDVEEAAKWYRKAAASGDESAKQALKKLEGAK